MISPSSSTFTYKIQFLKNHYYHSKADKPLNLNNIFNVKLFIHYSFRHKLSGFFYFQKIKDIKDIKEGSSASKEIFLEKLIKNAQELEKNQDLTRFNKNVEIIKILDSNFDEK